MARALIVAQDAINRKTEELNQAAQTIALQQQELKKQAPKVEYYDKAMQANGTYTFSQVAKEVGLRGATQLTALLHSLGYIYKQGKTWLPYAKHAEQKLFAIRTYTYTKQDGSQASSAGLVITEKGRQQIHSLVTETQTTKTVQQWS